jgi:hypothetical protein
MYRGWRFSLPESPGYIKQFLLINPYEPDLGTIGLEDLLRRLIYNLNSYRYLSCDFLFHVLKSLIFWKTFSWIVFFVIIVGFLYKILKEKTILEYYFLIYFAVLLLWPSAYTTMRFLIPIFPFIIYYFITGFKVILKEISSIFKKKFILNSLYISITIILISESISLISLIRFQEKYKENLKFYFLLKEKGYISVDSWIKNNTDRESIILCRAPSILSLLTDRKTLIYPFTKDSDKIIEFINKYKIDYIILDSFSKETPKYLIPAIKKNLDMFEVVTKIGKTLILKVVK